MPLMYIYDYNAMFSEGSPQGYAPRSSATQMSAVSSKYPTAASSILLLDKAGRRPGGGGGGVLVNAVSGGNAAGTSDLHLRLSGSP